MSHHVQSLQRLFAALTSADEAMRNFTGAVDACFGRGGSLVPPLHTYMTTEGFIRTERVNLARLEEFLHLFDDFEAPIAEAFGGVPNATLADLIEMDVLLALCSLETSTNRVTGVIVKMALYLSLIHI